MQAQQRDCNQCHHHLFRFWGQASGVQSRVEFRPEHEPGFSVVGVGNKLGCGQLDHRATRAHVRLGAARTANLLKGGTMKYSKNL